MLTYITRRVLYSIPVLLVSSFLSFTFVSLAGDPPANLRQNPKVSQLTLHLLAAPVPPRPVDSRSLLVLAAGRLRRTSSATR